MLDLWKLLSVIAASYRRHALVTVDSWSVNTCWTHIQSDVSSKFTRLLVTDVKTRCKAKRHTQGFKMHHAWWIGTDQRSNVDRMLIIAPLSKKQTNMYSSCCWNTKMTCVHALHRNAQMLHNIISCSGSGWEERPIWPYHSLDIRKIDNAA